jgi:hypothetical protein
MLARRRELVELLGVGDLVDEAALVEHAQEIGFEGLVIGCDPLR